MKKFEFLEHTADVYIAAYGENLARALENSALAMFETMTNTKNIRPEIEESVEVRGHDEQALLYNWLEELLVRFEVSNFLYSEFKIERIEKTEDGLRLLGKIRGESFDPDRHKPKVGIKAVTYHMMRIQRTPRKVTVRFILDI